MSDKKKAEPTQIMMICKNCGYRAMQSEIDENEGNCPNCNKRFEPLDDLHQS